MSMLDILDGISTVRDVEREFVSSPNSPRRGRGEFVFLQRDLLKRNFLEIITGVSKKQESDFIPGFCDHICRQCEYAIRTPHGRHHLFQFIPLRQVPSQDGLSSGKWYDAPAVMYTFCTADMDLPNTTQRLIPLYNEATIHEVPTKKCPKNNFMERNKK